MMNRYYFSIAFGAIVTLSAPQLSPQAWAQAVKSAAKRTGGQHATVLKPATPSATPKPAEPAWGSWTYLQGDKPVQYRVAKVGEEAGTALLKSQFRIEPDNKIACYSDRCDGFVVYLAVIDPDKRTTMAEHHLFFPRGSKAIWTLPETQRFTPKPTDWGRLYLDDQNSPSLAHTDTPGEHTRIRIFDTSCADDRMAGVASRCTDFDPSKQEVIGG